MVNSPICFEEASNSHYTVPCRHTFWFYCISIWGSDTCPLCRETVRSYKPVCQEPIRRQSYVHIKYFRIWFFLLPYKDNSNQYLRRSWLGQCLCNISCIIYRCWCRRSRKQYNTVTRVHHFSPRRYPKRIGHFVIHWITVIDIIMRNNIHSIADHFCSCKVHLQICCRTNDIRCIYRFVVELMIYDVVDIVYVLYQMPFNFQFIEVYIRRHQIDFPFK